jgi:signal transduction histidine kinase/DNA-binding response OmpR family regulator
LRPSWKLLTALIVAISLVLGVGLYATNASENALRNAVEQESSARATALMDEIDRIMQLRIAQWLAYSRGELIQRQLQASNEEFLGIDDVQELIDERDREWRSAPAGELSPLMIELTNGSLARDLQVRLDTLRSDAGRPVFAEVFVTNRFGANVAQTNRTTDYRQDDEEWWHAAIQHGLYIGDVAFDASAGVHSTDICIRVDGTDGRPAGVLKAVLNIEPVIEIIDSRIASESTGSWPRLVLMTWDHRIIHRANADDLPLQDGSEYFAGVMTERVGKVFTARRRDVSSGRDLLSAYAVSQGHAEYPGLGWILLLEYDAAEALAPATALRTQIILFSILSAAILALVGWPLALSMTREVASRRLAEKRAQAANRAKSQFLANMSHEIRTPMSGMLGMTSLLLDEELTADHREYVGTIRSCGENLLVILNDILDFSKVEEGQLEIQSCPFQLQELVWEVVELSLAHAWDKGVELIPRFSPGTPETVIGDPGRIRQVLVNLIGNAVKFTPAGHVLIEVETLASDERSAEIRFSVHDTGIGIPEEEQAMLFAPFAQADTSATRRFRGPGLGLAISKKLIELMSGSIGVASTPDEGSTFWFTLKLERPPDGIEQEPRASTLVERRILVVDTHPVRRRVLLEQLASRQARSVEAASPSQALSRLGEAARRGEPFELAILKLPMSRTELDIEEFARTVHSDPELGSPSLVLTTSRPARGDADRFQELAFAAYLVDPVRPDLLEECLATVLRARSGSEGLRAIVTHRTITDTRSAAASAAGSAGGERDTPVIPRHVLVAEDDPANRKIVSLLLERFGCTVDLAGDGAEAVAMARMGYYDLIFMDCQMPEMDGYEATARIRRHERGSQERVPIIALTASAMQGDRDRCLEAGMDDYLAKPVSRSQLEKMLRHWSRS